MLRFWAGAVGVDEMASTDGEPTADLVWALLEDQHRDLADRLRTVGLLLFLLDAV